MTTKKPPKTGAPPDQSGSMSTLTRLALLGDGFFTTADARSLGVPRQYIQHHLRHGRIERIRKGLYRLAAAPYQQLEAERAAFLAAGKGAVISHESALRIHDLAHDLSDVIPNVVHVTVPRDRRWAKLPGQVRIHTGRLGKDRIIERDGLRVTSLVRTLIDCIGTVAPDQVEKAIRNALRLKLITQAQLLGEAQHRPASTRNWLSSHLNASRAAVRTL